MKNKQKKSKGIRKMKFGILFIFIMVVVTGVIFVSGFEKEELEHEVRQIKDEVAMYKYKAERVKEEAKAEEETEAETVKVVCLDPGHGGKDPGSMAGKRMEKDENLKLALQVKENLEKYGIKVILTREDDSFVSLKSRAKYANKQNADLFVSLHRNYLAGYEEVNGVDIYINSAGSDVDYKLGNAFYDKLSSLDGMKVNEPKKGSATDETENYTVVAKTKMTACLIEMGYMSNKMDNVYFDDYFNSYSIAITEAIVEYLNYGLS